MSESEWFSLLGLANRARKVVSGEDLVIKEIRHSRAKLVLLADDAAANTEKKVTDKCRHYGVPVRTVSDRTLLGRAIGKESRVVVAVTDQGFANTLLRKLD
ncbi:MULTISPECIES: YlxQ family RNA-binding protein [Bacillus]|uniref:YlxQ family RNA-binding protein n=1 Tax=Bacillus TaxID=1386 RepID=UPI000421BA08|nr:MULTISPECIES: YlxQ family RNA-binding protein [Bacillus]QHZ46841.1 YlxQ family RNA-binding protein [Bacillus sp. NSP9.1]WFA06973.1 YlxQ family RNA-binding protein [Bacillus sp. HSf4]